MSAAIDYLDIEVMLFTTCNYNCAYCSFVTTGAVNLTADMAPFKDKAYIDQVLSFFERHSTPTRKWNLLFSGGEPLLTPNLDYLSGALTRAGHRLRYNTNLSVPIEKDERWLAANPPEAIDVLMVSLHPESLQQYDKIRHRVETLKKLGYHLTVRLVGHPELFEWFERVEKDYADLGVSFTPIPMFSTNYPKAYTDDQRTTLRKHIKAIGGMIQLHGGLDTSDQLCHAGERLFALALGRSGKGDLFRCVSCSPDGYLGNIFRDREIKFFAKPAPCCQKNKHCTCSFHFESNAVIGAEDRHNYEKLKTGQAQPVAAEFDELVRRGQLKFKNHERAPQGTDIGEKLLIYQSDLVVNLLLGRDAHTIHEITPQNVRAVEAYKKGASVTVADGLVKVAALKSHGGGVKFDFRAEVGRKMSLIFNGKVTKGDAWIAPYSGKEAHFWRVIPTYLGKDVVTEPFIPRTPWVTVYVYADMPVSFEFSRIAAVQQVAAAKIA